MTGAAGGIGWATVRAFLDEGARVVATDLDLGPLDDKLNDLPAAAAGRIRCAELDVSDEAAWAGVLGSVASQEGPLDVLVNNAGVALGRPLAETDIEDWRWVMSVNLDGAFLGIKHGIRAMRDRGGAIVNVGSALAVVGRPMTGAVAASKAGVVALTRTAALEMAARRHAVRVNAVLPGGVDTAIFREQGWWPERARPNGGEDAARASILGDTPMNRLGTAEEVAQAIVFLASDRAGFITGTTLTVDGGFTAA